MKRIVSGHFADPASTWDVAEISSEELAAITKSIEHTKKKYEYLLELNESSWRTMIAESNQIKTDAQNHHAETPVDALRKAVEKDLDIIAILKAKIILVILSKESVVGLRDLSSNEFRVLIDAVRHYCTDLTVAINATREEIEAAIGRTDEVKDFQVKENITVGLNKMSTEEYKEEKYSLVQKLFSILEIINEPYEGAEYHDAHGRKVEIVTKKSTKNSMSIN